MFVPFVYTLEVASDYDHYWPFLKYVEMACRYGWPVIAHERYFEKLHEDGIAQSLRQLENSWGYADISDEETSRMVCCPIPSVLEKEIVSRYPSQMDAWVDLLKNTNTELEEFLGSALDKLISDYGEPIEGILCFFVPAFLRAAAEKRHIRIFSNEQGAIRPPFYKAYTAYIESNIYSSGELERRYLRFLSTPAISAIPMLSRKGILRLFASNCYLQDIKLIGGSPKYEIGLLMNPRYGLHFQYSYMGDAELFLLAQREFPVSSILARSRAGFPDKFGTDDSPTSFHFSCKCKRIAAVSSNGLFEAMLIGRTVYGFGQHPFSFMENSSFDDNSVGIAPLEFLNYVVFAYFVPFDWIINPEYLRLRLTNPPETEIYMRGFKHWTQDISDEDLAFYYTGDGYEYRLGDTLYFSSGHLPHQYAPYYFLEGLSIQEDGFIWSLGASSAMRFDLGRQLDEQAEGQAGEQTGELEGQSEQLNGQLGGNLTLTFDIAMVYCDPKAEPCQRVVCTANDNVVGAATLAPEAALLEFEIPRQALDESVRLDIRLFYSHPAQPPGDTRELAVAFRSIRITCPSVINRPATLTSS
jgi:hypothetical protein